MVDKDQNSNDQENARIGYQVAVDLWGILVETSWSRFNAMVVANSIIIGMLALTLISDKKILFIFASVISIIGIILCILWFFLMKRDSEFQYYYSRSAGELEEYLNKVETVRRGHKFANGEKVSIKNGLCPTELEMSWNLKTRSLINWVIYLFIGIYFLIFMQTLWLMIDLIFTKPAFYYHIWQ